MTKKEMLKTLDTSSYYSLIAASVLVLMFEFTAKTLLLKLSILLYGAAFLILFVLCVLKLIYLKNETKEKEELLVDKTKENKTWIIIRMIFSVIFFAFTVVFLWLY